MQYIRKLYNVFDTKQGWLIVCVVALFTHLITVIETVILEATELTLYSIRTF